MLKPEQEEKAKEILRKLERKAGIIRKSIFESFDPLDEEKVLAKKLEFLNGPGGDTVSWSHYSEIERNLSELREVINLLGLRK